MDEQLKRRLVGATIVVTLAVIFVPMLFEDKSEQPATTVPEAPALPEAIEQKTIELPKTAADVAAIEAQEEQDKQARKGAAPATGYRVVPLDEPPPKPPAKPETAATGERAEVPRDEEDMGDEDMAAPASKAPPAPVKPLQPPVRAKPPAGNLAPAPATAAKPPMTPVKPAEPPPKDRSKRSTETSTAPKPPPKPAETPVRKTDKPIDTAARPTAPAGGQKKPQPAPEAARPARTPPPKTEGTAKDTREPRHVAMAEEAGKPSAWIVQVGSFTVETNARALADKLRKQSLSATVRRVHGSAGEIYKVQIGPEPNRARAEQMQKQIEQTVGLHSLLVPQR